MRILRRIYDSTIGRVVREIAYRRRLKALRKRDPFIY